MQNRQSPVRGRRQGRSGPFAALTLCLQAGLVLLWGSYIIPGQPASDADGDDGGWTRDGSDPPVDDPAPDPQCGNDVGETGEECDGNSGLAGEACLEDCTLNRAGCCPDGTISHRVLHDNSIWKETNTVLARGGSVETETRTFCVDLVLSDGDSVSL